MLEQLFSSKTRTKMLRLFLASQASESQGAFYVREITRKIGEHINSVRKELENLVSLGLVVETDGPEEESSRKKYYRASPEFAIYPELRALIFKAQLLLEKSLAKRMEELGDIGYLALTGTFTSNAQSPTDLLVIGEVDRKKLGGLIREFEENLGREINYTVMSRGEYRDRHELTDRFLFNILENERIELINRLA